jgi:16S rRNA (uracil1498-N3)-methyltransferase
MIYFIDADTNYLSGNEYHHLVKVLRVKVNTEINVSYNNLLYLCNVIEITDSKVYFEKVKLLKTDKLNNITLIQGIPKQKKFETVIKNCCYLGVRKLIFVKMIRSENDNIIVNNERINLIIKEACSLAKRSELLEVKVVNSLNLALNNLDIIYLADEDELKKSLKDYLCQDQKEMNIGVVIGPEGGIDKKERELIIKLGGLSITLGSLIFPTEYACIPTISIINELLK